MVKKYLLSEEDIGQLTKPSPWRDWLRLGDPRPFEEFYEDWLKKHDNTTRDHTVD